MKALTWDDLANFYDKKTGGRARTRPMDAVYEWGTRQPEIRVDHDDDGTLYWKDADGERR